MTHYLDNEQHLHWRVCNSGIFCYIPQDAIDAIGEVVFVEVSAKINSTVKKGDVFCIIETAKKCFELTVPFDGKIIGIGMFAESLGKEGHLVAVFDPDDNLDFSGDNFEEIEITEGDR